MKFKKSFKCVAAAALFAVFAVSLVVSGCSGVFQKLDPPGVSSALGNGVSGHIKSVLGSGGGGIDFKKYESAVSQDPSIVKPSITNGGKDLVMEALRPGKCDVTLIVRLTNGQTVVYVIEVEVDDDCNAKFELPKVPIMSYSYDVKSKVKEKTNPEKGEEVSRVTGVFLPTNASFISAASFSGATATFAGNANGDAGSADADIMVVLGNGKPALYRVSVQVSNNGTVEVTDGDVLYRSDTFDFAKYFKENYGLDVESVFFSNGSGASANQNGAADKTADVDISGKSVKVQGKKIGATSKTVCVKTSKGDIVTVDLSISIGSDGKISVVPPSVITTISNEADLSKLGASGSTNVTGGGSTVDASIIGSTLKVTPKEGSAGTVTELTIDGKKVYAAVTANGGVKIYGNFDTSFTNSASGQTCDLLTDDSCAVGTNPACNSDNEGIVTVQRETANNGSLKLTAVKPGMTTVTASTTENGKTVDYKYFVTVNNDGSIVTEQVSRFVHNVWEFDIVKAGEEAGLVDGKKATINNLKITDTNRTSAKVTLDGTNAVVDNNNGSVSAKQENGKFHIEGLKPTSSPVKVKFRIRYPSTAMEGWAEENVVGGLSKVGTGTVYSGAFPEIFYADTSYMNQTIECPATVSIAADGTMSVSYEPCFPQGFIISDFNQKLPNREWGLRLSADLKTGGVYDYIGDEYDIVKARNAGGNRNNTILDTYPGGHWTFRTTGKTGAQVINFENNSGMKIPVEIVSKNGVIQSIRCLPFPTVTKVVDLKAVTNDAFGYNLSSVSHIETKMTTAPDLERAGKPSNKDIKTDWKENVSSAMDVSISGGTLMSIIGKQKCTIDVYFWANGDKFDEGKYDNDLTKQDMETWDNPPSFYCTVAYTDSGLDVDDWPTKSEALIEFLAEADKHQSKFARSVKEELRKGTPMFIAANRGFESYTAKGFVFKKDLDHNSIDYQNFFEAGLSPESLWNMVPDSLKPYTVMELHENKQSRLNQENMKLWIDECLTVCDNLGIPAVVTFMAAASDGIPGTTYYTFNYVDPSISDWALWLKKMKKKHPSWKGVSSTEHYWTGTPAVRSARWIEWCAKNDMIFIINDQKPDNYMGNATFRDAVANTTTVSVINYDGTKSTVENTTYGREALVGAYKYTDTHRQNQKGLFAGFMGWWLNDNALAWGTLEDTWSWAERGYSYLGGPSKSRYNSMGVAAMPQGEFATFMMQVYLNGGQIFSYEAPWSVYGYDDMRSEYMMNSIAPMFKYFEKHPAPARDKIIEGVKILPRGETYPGNNNANGTNSPLFPDGRYGTVPYVNGNISTLVSGLQNKTGDNWDHQYPEVMSDNFRSPNDVRGTAFKFKDGYRKTDGTGTDNGTDIDWLVYNSKTNFLNQGVNGIDNDTGSGSAWDPAGPDIQYVQIPLKGKSNSGDASSNSRKKVQIRLTPHTGMMITDKDGKLTIYMTNYRLDQVKGFDAAGGFSNTYSAGPYIKASLCGADVNAKTYMRDTVFTFEGCNPVSAVITDTQKAAGYGKVGDAPYFTGRDAGESVVSTSGSTVTVNGNGWSILEITYEQ